MNLKQIIVSAAGIVLVVVLFVFGRYLPEEKPGLGKRSDGTQGTGVTNRSQQFSDYKAQQMALLPDSAKTDAQTFEEEYQQATVDSIKEQWLLELEALWRKHRSSGMTAYYTAKLAEMNGNVKTWLASGDLYMGAYFNEVENPAIKMYLRGSAVESYEQAANLAPDNLEVKLRLASAYMESQGMDVMQKGVPLLLEVVEEDPDNLEANLILGRAGIMSGQYEKAIGRFETVIGQEPNNVEALLGLGEAHSAIGNNQQAIDYLKQCKALVDNARFDAEIDNMIRNIQNK